MSLFQTGLLIASIWICSIQAYYETNRRYFPHHYHSSNGEKKISGYDHFSSVNQRNPSIARENRKESTRFNIHLENYPKNYNSLYKSEGGYKENIAKQHASIAAAYRQFQNEKEYRSRKYSTSSSDNRLKNHHSFSTQSDSIPYRRDSTRIPGIYVTNMEKYLRKIDSNQPIREDYVWSGGNFQTDPKGHVDSADEFLSRSIAFRSASHRSSRERYRNNFPLPRSQENTSNRSSKSIFYPKEIRSLSKTMNREAISRAGPGDPDSITVTGSCPIECYPDNLEQAYVECEAFEDFGCSLFLCGTGAEGYQCGIDQLEHDVPVEPGAEIEIESISVYDSVQFKVNLNASFPLRTDFYLLSDATGSMSEEISEVRSKFKQVVDLFEGMTDAYFGVGFYRDEADYNTINGFKNLQSLTGDRSKVYAAINKLESKGSRQNTDLAEATLVGLHKVATDGSANWRPDSRKILVYFGDQSGHEPTCIGRTTITRQSVIEEMGMRNITVIAVSFNPGLDTAPGKSYGCAGSPSPAGAEQGTDIATATNGAILPNTQPAEFIEKLQDAVLNLKRVYDLDLSDCEGKLTVQSNPDFPVTLGRGETATVEETVVIEPGACQEGGQSFECNLKYTEGGASLPPTAFRLLNIRGC